MPDISRTVSSEVVHEVLDQVRRASADPKFFPRGIDRIAIEASVGVSPSLKVEVAGSVAPRGTQRLREVLEWHEQVVLRELRRVRIIARADDGRVAYDADKAFAYARQWCRDGNSCGEQYDSDCAHFMGHCLSSGGIKISNPDTGANCPAGLNVRVEYLAQALSQLAQQYTNVLSLTFDDRTQKGDYGLLKSWVGTPDHAFLLNDGVDADGQSAPIYGHTNYRCGDSAQASFIDARYYRIQP